MKWYFRWENNQHVNFNGKRVWGEDGISWGCAVNNFGHYSGEGDMHGIRHFVFPVSWTLDLWETYLRLTRYHSSWGRFGDVRRFFELKRLLDVLPIRQIGQESCVFVSLIRLEAGPWYTTWSVMWHSTSHMLFCLYDQLFEGNLGHGFADSLQHGIRLQTRVPRDVGL